MNKQRLVDDFMRKAGQYKGLPAPGTPDAESRVLRVKLILEEALEFARASGVAVRTESSSSHMIYDIDDIKLSTHDYLLQDRLDIVEAADALADLLYVVYGSAVAWGIRIDPVFGAVHDANMDKFAPGSFAREDGKWIKPSGWEPPDIAAVLEAQGWSRDATAQKDT